MLNFLMNEFFRIQEVFQCLCFKYPTSDIQIVIDRNTNSELVSQSRRWTARLIGGHILVKGDLPASVVYDIS